METEKTMVELHRMLCELVGTDYLGHVTSTQIRLGREGAELLLATLKELQPPF